MATCVQVHWINLSDFGNQPLIPKQRTFVMATRWTSPLSPKTETIYWQEAGGSCLFYVQLFLPDDLTKFVHRKHNIWLTYYNLLCIIFRINLMHKIKSMLTCWKLYFYYITYSKVHHPFTYRYTTSKHVNPLSMQFAFTWIQNCR